MTAREARRIRRKYAADRNAPHAQRRMGKRWSAEDRTKTKEEDRT